MATRNTLPPPARNPRCLVRTAFVEQRLASYYKNRDGPAIEGIRCPSPASRYERSVKLASGLARDAVSMPAMVGCEAGAYHMLMRQHSRDLGVGARREGTLVAMRYSGCDKPLSHIPAVIGAAFALPLAVLAHPGQHLDLRVSIDDERVVYTILISNDLARKLISDEDYRLELSAAGDRFRFLDAEQERQARQAYDSFFSGINPVTIDGVRVKPILEELHFVPAVSPVQDRAALPPDIRVILEHPTKGRPKQVSMVWNVYPQDPSRAFFGLPSAVEVVAELDAYDENKIIMFTENEPEVVWHTPGRPATQGVTPVIVSAEPPQMRIPLASLAILAVAATGLVTLWFSRLWPSARRPALGTSLLALGAALYCHDMFVVRVTSPWRHAVTLPGRQAAVDIFASLHRNVYRAFDYKTESDIYDVLAQSVDGPLLDQVYNEVYESLILRDQGGAVARVQSVEFLGNEVVSSGVLTDSRAAAFKVRSRWRVRGVVYHWGHVHSRTNEYKAVYAIAQRADRWKITGVDVLAQRRIVMAGDDPPLSLPEIPEEAER